MTMGDFRLIATEVSPDTEVLRRSGAATVRKPPVPQPPEGSEHFAAVVEMFHGSVERMGLGSGESASSRQPPAVAAASTADVARLPQRSSAALRATPLPDVVTHLPARSTAALRATSLLACQCRRRHRRKRRCSARLLRDLHHLLEGAGHRPPTTARAALQMAPWLRQCQCRRRHTSKRPCTMRLLHDLHRRLQAGGSLEACMEEAFAIFQALEVEQARLIVPKLFGAQRSAPAKRPAGPGDKGQRAHGSRATSRRATSVDPGAPHASHQG